MSHLSVSAARCDLKTNLAPHQDSGRFDVAYQSPRYVMKSDSRVAGWILSTKPCRTLSNFKGSESFGAGSSTYWRLSEQVLRQHIIGPLSA